jgi:hypothetical protein
MTPPSQDRPLLVLLDALEQYYRHLHAKDTAGRALFEAVERWFASRDACAPLGFEGVCTTIGLDAARIRATLMRRRAEALHVPTPSEPKKR